MTDWLGVGAAVARRPRLWATAARQLRALTPPGRVFPPGPDPAYRRFRALTQYGVADHPLDPADVTSYLEWCRRGHGAARRVR